MVKKKPVPPLRQFCLQVLPKMITDRISNMARKASALKWYSVFHGQVDLDCESVIRNQVAVFKELIYENVIWYDHEEVFRALLKGIEDAVAQTRQGWSLSSNMAQYRQEMEAMSAFTDIVLFPYLKRLEFFYVPKSLRSRITESLGKFDQLRVLVLNSGVGGQWLFRGTSKLIASGMLSLNKLKYFSCKHDCTYEMIESLSKSCANTLTTLDVEGSKRVGDDCYPLLLSLINLEELHLFNTPLSEEYKARLIMSLPRLTRLPKGDFLCDALGWIDYLEEMAEPKFLINEFYPSQDYFFHEEWQMEMVSRMCPFISKMFFIFHETCMPSLTFIANFDHITELCLYGGSFYKDGLDRLIAMKGSTLTKLQLISMATVDFKAVAIISNHCSNLLSFSLLNCDLGDYRPRGDINSDEEYERRQAFMTMAKEAHETVNVMKSIEEVSINCQQVRPVYCSFLLGRCPFIRYISLGRVPDFSDETLFKIYAQHGLRHLEEFHCDYSSGLTMRSVALLINSCDNLKALSDLQSWTKINPADVGQFRESCHQQNLSLDTRSHQRLRKYLEMRQADRKAYIHSITGPTLERLRMAQRARDQGLVEQED